MKNFNNNIFEEAKQKLGSRSEKLTYLERLIPDGKVKSSEYVARNPTRNDKNLGSFSINLNTGAWSDFATNDGGGDLISLTAHIKGINQYKAACEILEISLEQAKSYNSAKVISLSHQTKSVTPPTREITDNDIKHYIDEFKCSSSARYKYTDIKGNITNWICRWDLEREGIKTKEIRPLKFDYSKNKWISGFSDYRPLYNLPDLITYPDRSVLIVEGEKTAEAAKQLFPLYVVVTSMGGANGTKKSDWSVLEGRDVIISRDYDNAGDKWLKNIIESCKDYVHSVQVLPPEALGRYIIKDSQLVEREEEIPVGYDLADALEEGWTAQLIIMEIDKDKSFFVSYDSIMPSANDLEDKEEILDFGKNRKYKLTKNWLYLERSGAKSNEDHEDTYWERICGAIRVTHDIEDSTEGRCGLLLKIITNRGIPKEVFIQRKELADDKVIKSLLLEQGLHIEQLKQFGKGLLTSDILNHYINHSKPAIRAIGIDKVGWHDDKIYVVPYVHDPRKAFRITDSLEDNNQRAESQEYILQSNSANPRRLTIKGTLQDWQENIGKHLIENHALIFASAVALAAPFLTPLGEDGGCFHFSGSSSIGKTKTLLVASSIWGMGKPGSFRITDNAAESVCKNANDGLILMDELGQADAAALEKLIYLLGNGTGKGRANKNGEAQRITTFKILGLSTGEIDLAAKLAEKDKGSTAGQEVRFIELPADAGKGYGIFDNIHQFKDSEEFAYYLEQATNKYCGTVMEQFLESITSEFSETRKYIEQIMREWLTNNVSPEADSQVKRVAKKFALVAAAGEIAVLRKIFPFDEFAVSKSCKILFDRWVEKRGGTGSFEYKTIKSNLRKLIQQQGDARFSNADDSDAKVFGKRAGYKKLSEDGLKIAEYWINSDVFHDEILEGRDTKVFCSQLVKDGYLIRKQNDRNFPQLKRPSKQNPTRFYIISAAAVNESEEV